MIENIEDTLKKKKIEYQVFKHEPVYTSEQAARVRGVPPESGVKAMVLKTKDKSFILALVPGNKKIDIQDLSKIVGSKLGLASPEEVLAATSCKIGSVPAICPKLQTYMDRLILKNEYVYFNAGLHTLTIKMKSKDLKDVVNPIMGSFSK